MTSVHSLTSLLVLKAKVGSLDTFSQNVHLLTKIYVSTKKVLFPIESAWFCGNCTFPGSTSQRSIKLYNNSACFQAAGRESQPLLQISELLVEIIIPVERLDFCGIPVISTYFAELARNI